MLVELTFVEETFVAKILFAERFVEETEARLDCPVAVKVATRRLPEPVAFVNVRPVEETRVKTGVEVTSIVPEAEIVRFDPILKVDVATPPIVMEEVVIYPLLLVHCDMFADAKFAVVSPVEVVRTATPFWVMVPEALNATLFKS
jgi:hypothetical protein